MTVERAGAVSFSPAQVQADAARPGPKKSQFEDVVVSNGSGRPTALSITYTNVDLSDSAQRQAVGQHILARLQGTGVSTAQIDAALQPGGVLAKAIAATGGLVQVHAIEGALANSSMSPAVSDEIAVPVTVAEAAIAPSRARAKTASGEVTFPHGLARNAVVARQLQQVRMALATGLRGDATSKADILADETLKAAHTLGQLALADPLFAEYRQLRAELGNCSKAPGSDAAQVAYLRAIDSLDRAAANVSRTGYNPEAAYALAADGTLAYDRTPPQKELAEELRQSHQVLQDWRAPRLQPLGDPNDPLYGLFL